MEQAIRKCYLCDQWFIESVLEEIKVPDQAGYVKKAACKQCVKEVEERSKGGKP